MGYSLVKGIGDGEPIASERFTVGGHEWVSCRDEVCAIDARAPAGWLMLLWPACMLLIPGLQLVQ